MAGFKQDGAKAGRDGGSSGRQGATYADMRSAKRHRNAQDGRDDSLMKGKSLVNVKKNADYQDQAKFAKPISFKGGGTPNMNGPLRGIDARGQTPSTPNISKSQVMPFTSAGGGFTAKGGIPGEKTSRGNPFQGRSKMGAGGPTGMGGNAKMWGSGGDSAHTNPKDRMWGNNRRSGGP